MVEPSPVEPAAREPRAEPSSGVDLRRELGEARALTIKTNNLASALNAEVKSIGRRLDQRERAVLLNSAVAYVLFVALLGGAFYVVHRMRVERAEFEKDGSLREAAAARAELTHLQKRDEFYLAAALDQAKKREQARAEYQKFLVRYPQHKFAGLARRRVVELQQGK
jgi:hypothetical protein